MAAKIAKMEDGTFAWQAAGIIYSLEEWQAYDFGREVWVPAKDLIMWAYIKVGNFDRTLQSVASRFSQDVTVYAFCGNECFGALRPVPK